MNTIKGFLSTERWLCFTPKSSVPSSGGGTLLLTCLPQCRRAQSSRNQDHRGATSSYRKFCCTIAMWKAKSLGFIYFLKLSFVRSFLDSCRLYSANCNFYSIKSCVCFPCIWIVIPGTLVLALISTPALSKPLAVVLLGGMPAPAKF